MKTLLIGGCADGEVHDIDPRMTVYTVAAFPKLKAFHARDVSSQPEEIKTVVYKRECLSSPTRNYSVMYHGNGDLIGDLLAGYKRKSAPAQEVGDG